MITQVFKIPLKTKTARVKAAIHLVRMVYLAATVHGFEGHRKKLMLFYGRGVINSFDPSIKSLTITYTVNGDEP